MPTAKQMISWLVIIFVIFFIVTQPSQAADDVHSIWHVLVNIFHGLADFISSL
jgi:hypothetical protein